MGMLAVGAGAAKGLQQQLENLLAEEESKRRQQDSASVIQGRTANQGFEARRLDQGDRALGYQGRTQDRLDTSADIANKGAQLKIDTLQSIMGPGGAGAAGPSFPNAAGAQPPTEMGPLQPVPPTKPGGNLSGMNNPEGRAKLEIAGLHPNDLYGSVQHPDKPENLTPEESYYASYAREHGISDYHQIPSNQMAKLRRQWAEDSHITSPAQNSEQMLQTMDPNNPGQTIWTPRSQAAGLPGPQPAGQKDKILAYNSTLDLIDEIEGLGKKTGWKGLGPVEGRLGSIGKEYLGIGSDDEEQLRNKLNQLKAQASFQEGGKQFTGTEKQMLDAFLAGVNQNPAAVQDRLKTFRESAQRSLTSMGAGRRSGVTTIPTTGGDGLYEEYLKRTTKPAGGGGM